MAEPLLEIADQLRQMHRFVTPVITDLDSGRTYAAHELDLIPKGVDPRALSKSQKRLDLGELICKPVVQLIPPTWHPNLVTMANHLCNWLLLALALSSLSFDGNLKIAALTVCAVLNFVCMMLDCLDGMHARNTKQTSKLGELLDHWLDALHVPLVTAGISYALRMPPWALAAVNTFNATLYASQLIVYHYQRVFIQTSGVEAQIGTSALYLLAAALAHLPEDQGPAFWTSRLIAVTGIVTALLLSRQFLVRYDRTMFAALAKVALFCGVPSLMFALGFMPLFGYLVLMPSLSFRLTGSYVLYSITQRHYRGHDCALIGWLVALLWTTLAMEPLPLATFFSRPLPYLGCAGAWMREATVQQAVPCLMALHLAVQNIQDVMARLHAVKQP